MPLGPLDGPPVWTKSSDHVGARQLPWGLSIVLLLSLVWRLPSLFDPPWVNDEGTYFAIAQAMSHGFRLYADVWENKPPGIYLLYGAVYHPFGASLVMIRILATAAVLGIVALVFVIGRHYTRTLWALCAALFVGLLMGTPFLEGTTANAEVFLALFTALGVYLGVVKGHPLPAGVAVAIAVLCKAVAGFDAVAIGLWYVYHERTSLFLYAGALAGTLGVGLVALAVSGILPDMINDAVLYDVGYISHGNGGSIPWVLGVKLLLLGGLTVLLRRGPLPYIWLVYAAAGALVSGRVFGHYTLQMMVPFALTGVLIARPWLDPRRAFIALPLLFAGGAAVCGALGWVLAASGHDSIFARRLQYYPNFARYALRLEARAAYQAQIDDHVDRNIHVAGALAHLPGGRLLVWGNTPWIYVLSRRLPATPYTSSRRQPPVPGETQNLLAALDQGKPRILVVINPPDPPLPRRGSHGRHRPTIYLQTRRIDNATIFVRRP